MKDHTRHYFRGQRWHVWSRTGWRFGFGVIPQMHSPVDTRTELIFWLGPILISRRVGRG